MTIKAFFLAICCSFLFTHPSLGQNQKGVLVIGLQDSIILSDSLFIKDISIKKKFLKKTYKDLVKQATDSTIMYCGNTFKVLYHSEDHSTSISKGKFPDYLRGKIYKMSPYDVPKLIRKVQQDKQTADSLIQNREVIKDIALNFGFSITNFQLAENDKYFSNQVKNNLGFLNLFLTVNYVLKLSKQLYYRVGLGCAAEATSLFPIINITKTGLSKDTSLYVGEIASSQYLALMPLEISYDYILPQGFRLTISAGLENQYRIVQGKKTATIFNNLNNNSGPIVSDPTLKEAVSNYYADFIKPFSLQYNMGLGMLTPENVSLGIKWHYFLSPVFNHNQHTTKKSGTTIFVNVPLFNIKPKGFKSLTK